ncbi:hypothetical protein B5C28_12265 [Corynebacterium glutamicum]|nr:hypothetical protein B5C28_12265 [Corynebacterium glutamicum]
MPPYCPQDDLARDTSTREDSHRLDHSTALCLPPQLCNSTFPTSTLPPWLLQALEQDLRLSPEVINELSQDEAQQLLVQHWTKPQGSSDTTVTGSGGGGRQCCRQAAA